MSKKISAAALFLFVFTALLFYAHAPGRAQTSASQTLTLKSGFNFVSFTVQSYLSPQKLMELNTNITDIYSYNAAAGSFISASDGALSSIAPGKGYIVKASTDASLNTSGITAGTIGDITLRTGFNLAGFSKPLTAATTFSSIMAGYPVIKGMYKWNAASGSFMQVVRNAAGTVEKLDGVDPSIAAEQAYFINVTSDTTLNYDGGTVIIGGQSAVTSVYPNEYAAAGSVTLPAGAQTALTDLTICTNTSSSSVSLNGSFSASVGADTGVSVAPVIAVNKSGNPAMMKLAAISGSTTDSDPISASTTADALVLFDPCFYKLGSADFQKAKTLLASHASRAELIALVENAIKTDPTAPLSGTAHADIYAKAVAISADILAQIPSATVISTAGPDRYADGTDQSKDIYIEDDESHNSPYVTIVNTTYCYYDVTAYNTKQLNSFNFLPKCEVLPKVDWSWPPGISSSARNDVYMGDGDLEFHFRKNQLLTTANIASSIISIAIGVGELKGTQLKAKEEALKIAGGAVASFFQKWLNYTAPATKKDAVLAVISFGGDICSIAADITFLLYPDLKDNLKGRVLSVSFINNAFKILESKLNAWKYATTAFSAADTAFSLWSLTNAEVFLDYQGRQENGYYPKAATTDTQNKTVDLGGGTLMELVYVNPGTFTMGSPDSDTLSSIYEKPQHQVTLTKGFWIGKYEVTQKQWTVIMGSNPSPSGYGIGDSYPVHKINSSDCFSFISKLNAKQLITGTFKLPTEAQWEYACRAGTTMPYYLTAADPMSSCGWYSGNSKTDSPTNTVMAHPVGQKTPNAFGLYDMLGNVGEFCSDMYAGASYTPDAATDPTGETGSGSYSSHVIRGGNFYVDAKYCRSASRTYSLDETTQAVGSAYGVYNVGLRVILMQ